MIKPGKPRVFEQGTCPGMDENNHPEGKYVRVGNRLAKGLGKV